MTDTDTHYTNDDIKAACLPIPREYQLREYDRIVYRLSDAPPQVCNFFEAPSWLSRMHIWGFATNEAERMVEVRQRQFREVWGR